MNMAQFNKVHGMSQNNVIYRRWSSMKSRCNNPNNIAYDRYGGRGIKVCDEWDKSFIKFYEWAIQNGFREDLSLDRIDNNKGYSPDNCRWATRFEQARNVRRNHMITYNGKTQCIGAWAEETGIRRDTLLYRIKHFDSLDDVFEVKSHKPWSVKMKG
jgi:hypothetical protein